MDNKLLRSLRAIPAPYRIPVATVGLAAWVLVVVGIPYMVGLRGLGLLLMSALGAIVLAVSFIPYDAE